MVRFSNRYILCEIFVPGKQSFPANIDGNKIYQALRDSLIKNHGDLGLGTFQASLKVIYLNPLTNIVIIRGQKKDFSILSTALLFIEKIAGISVVIRSLHISGTIRQCLKFLIKYHRHKIINIYPECKTDDERAKVLESLCDRT